MKGKKFSICHSYPLTDTGLRRESRGIHTLVGLPLILTEFNWHLAPVPQLLGWMHKCLLSLPCMLYKRVDASFFYDATRVIFSPLLIVKLQLQAEERGVVSIKGVCANRYLAMKEDGRLLASVSNVFSFCTFF